VNISVAALRSWFRSCALSSFLHWQATDPNTTKADSVYVLFCAFKMLKMIELPADCEIRSVMRFLNARIVKPADIHRNICTVYGEIPWMVEWRENGLGSSTKFVINCITSRGAAGRLWSQAATFYEEVTESGASLW
jgi:hypothetical protein